MKKLFFFVAMTSLFMTACEGTKEQPEPITGVTQLKLNEVVVSDMVARAGVPVEYTQSIGLNLTAIDSYVAVEGQKVDAVDWAIDPTIPLGKNDRSLTAWGPYSITPDTGKGNTFTLTSDLYDAGKDLVYKAATEVSAAAPAVDLVFEHAYSQVTLKFTKDANYLDPAPVVKGLTLKSVPGTATLDIATGTASVPVDTKDITLYAGDSGLFTDAYLALVVPMASGAAMSVDCMLDTKSYTVDLTSVVPVLENGNNYVVTLNLKGTVMSVASVKVYPWNDVNSSVDLN